MPPSNYLAANFGGPVNPTVQPATAPGGSLPFTPGGNPFSQDLGMAYSSAYNSALGLNQANYTNILKGYQDTLAQQTTAQDAIGKGYGQLYNNVMQGIQGIDQSQRQAIADSYAQQSGASQQDLINRGLGNSTVLSSVQRGNQLDKQKADIALSNQTAQLGAGYASQLGGAGLNYANQAATQNAAQQNQQLAWMNSINAPYPNAALYAGIAQQQGAVNQSNLNRQQAADQFKQMMDASKAAQGRAGGGGGLPSNYLPAPNLGPLGGGGNAGYSPLSSVTPFQGQGASPYGLGIPNPNFGGGLAGPGGAIGGGIGVGGAFGGQGDVSGMYQQPPGSVSGNALAGTMGIGGAMGGSPYAAAFGGVGALGTYGDQTGEISPYDM